MSEEAAPIPSPCRRECQLHPIEKQCLGCFRTIDEISRWIRLSEAERTRITADLPARRAARAAREEMLKTRRMR
ncbi:DUF1289 domain-containing protein [Siculibacillus lacustris]|uniref:DUF1289 domain-containing protein n=1 Tax=Siculibacillus lacustris TaxID=1549641 RepID=A0A4Q9VX40_9HYPH|nr:DUF1289 domain-containing protein [Siculibacillus lacustris]TBW40940.1 DUF1289 domain-containing protein [Siculibacillus lacustris]